MTRMQAVTIREAKARLHALVEAAERGEQVVLMRGAKHVALIVPLSAEDLEVSPRLTDARAERLWHQIAAERGDGSSVVMETPEKAVAFLGKKASRPRGGRRRGGWRSRSASRVTSGTKTPSREWPSSKPSWPYPLPSEPRTPMPGSESGSCTDPASGRPAWGWGSGSSSPWSRTS